MKGIGQDIFKAVTIAVVSHAIKELIDWAIEEAKERRKSAAKKKEVEKNETAS
jgi:hypothetical protein